MIGELIEPAEFCPVGYCREPLWKKPDGKKFCENPMCRWHEPYTKEELENSAKYILRRTKFWNQGEILEQEVLDVMLEMYNLHR